MLGLAVLVGSAGPDCYVLLALAIWLAPPDAVAVAFGLGQDFEVVVGEMQHSPA